MNGGRRGKLRGMEGRQIKGEEKQEVGKGVGGQVKDEGWTAEGMRNTRSEGI